MSRRWKISNPKFMFVILLLLKWNSFPKYWVPIWSPIQWNWLWLAKRSWLSTHWNEPSQGRFFRIIGGTKSEWAGQSRFELCTICHTQILSLENHFENIIRPCQDGLYQVRGEPSKFYHCFQGVKFDEISCPPGLLFNEGLGVCDWPSNVAVLPVVNPFECFDGIYTAWGYGWYWYCYDSQLYYEKCPEPLEVSFFGHNWWTMSLEES